MRKKWAYAIQIALLLVMISGLITGCAGLSSGTTATVEGISAGRDFFYGGGLLFVDLKPTSSTIADRVYTVELYEKGKLRATVKVSWNQPEINVSKMKPVQFPLTRAETEAYIMENDLSHIFSVKVHE